MQMNVSYMAKITRYAGIKLFIVILLPITYITVYSGGLLFLPGYV